MSAAGKARQVVELDMIRVYRIHNSVVEVEGKYEFEENMEQCRMPDNSQKCACIRNRQWHYCKYRYYLTYRVVSHSPLSYTENILS